MDEIKQYSRHSFIGIMLLMLILVLIVDSVFYYGMTVLFSKISITSKAGEGLPQVVGLVSRIALLQKNLRVYFVPASMGAFLVFGFLLWLYLRASFVKHLKSTADSSAIATTASPEETAAKKKQKIENDQRLFLHLLSVFQREGRLVDFFSEDLNHYEDQQIGAAVRSIHENCKKSLDKYVTLSAMIDSNEGDEITIEAGFDPGAIKLTGNITGEPPFKGILRHRGWQAMAFNIPALSEGSNPGHIAPAEVEIK